ncbi:YqzE family protein [Halalkalibacter sp. APA_J-10(15)]|uniref:YqzE family protein n=1 Tax=unclassified Halalkalibacter TaxID=2893063 RepID=UPI001FF6034F|nr:YqzE family protein [Halalkalibacter sp. APA_J-10(15)]MCK0472586.1 YqzE family protein [Halalkalibacter sp. APA_J-10(15)]
MSINDYVKYLTEQVVTKMDQPSEVRKSVKEERKMNRPPLSFHLFGMIPMAFSLLVRNKRKNK